jgi:hypothetical protein
MICYILSCCASAIFSLVGLGGGGRWAVVGGAWYGGIMMVRGLAGGAR